MRHIEAGDELCIYYGDKLWFEDNSLPLNLGREASVAKESHNPTIASTSFSISASDDCTQDTHTELLMQNLPDSTAATEPQEDASAITISDTQLPLKRFRFPDERITETDLDPISTMPVWVVDVNDLAKIGPTLGNLRTCVRDSEAEALRHLKRVRRIKHPETEEVTSSIILAPAYIEEFGTLPLSSSVATALANSQLSALSPYLIEVPASAAVNPSQLARKSAIWPVVYLPSLDEEKKERKWTRPEVEWVRKNLSHIVSEAIHAKEAGELPIAAYATSSLELAPVDMQNTAVISNNPSWVAYDSRRSLQHPLRHACLNLVRIIAAFQADQLNATQAEPKSVSQSTKENSSSPRTVGSMLESATSPSIGEISSSYLLTGLSLFITHEPCVMCSMALLHSRVKEIFYIYSMESTGGCGGLIKDSVPGLKGVNHRFPIWKWVGSLDSIGIKSKSDILVENAVDI
ncbi:hypothetical protein FRC03_012448 [Tulasnella sp. 419]|nr:hypothetical protein FRC03_012448 [Tulasnella sp. 419]